MTSGGCHDILAMKIIRTNRLDLVPATLTLVEADIESPEALARRLGATVPASWPPGEYDRSAMEFFRDRLSEDPEAVGWYGWYAVHRPVEPHGAVLVGTGGYLGPPNADGVAEIGYSIVPESRGLGFATELVHALVSRAFSKPQVVRVIAATTSTNLGSVRVLERCGFSLVGPGSEPGTVQYATTRPTT
jgi:RimJ/RimL family protein N-acetyltransferase